MATPSAAQPPSLPAPPNFLSLPPELHIKIYEHYFTPPHPSAAGLPRLHRRGTSDAAYPATNILITNWQIHKDALPVFYTTHTFSFTLLAWPRAPPSPALYVAPEYNNDFLLVAPLLRNLSLGVTPALFQVEAMQAFQCTLQLDRILPEILQVCPVLRTLTIELNSKTKARHKDEIDVPEDQGYWFVTGRPLHQDTKFFWLFQEAKIRIEFSSNTFPSHAGEVVVPEERQPLHEVLLCDLEKFTGRDLTANEVWEHAFMAALGREWVKFKGNGARDPRGRMVGYTQAGREIWREAWWKGVLKARM